MTVTIKFDGSLQQKDNGACFTIIARDQHHARMIAEWLRKVCNCDSSEVYISATQELPPQSCAIQV